MIDCKVCKVSIKRKPSEVGVNNFCSKKCHSQYRKMPKDDKFISLFIKTSWTNMNLRAGKYRHLQSRDKNYNYDSIRVECDRKDFKNWCLSKRDLILNLKRPSIDRVDSTKNYRLDNMQIIELSENIRKDKTKFDKTHGVCCRCDKVLEIRLFAKDKRNYNGHSTICRECDNLRRRLNYVKNTTKEQIGS